MSQIDYLWEFQKIENAIEDNKIMLENIGKAKEIGEKIKEHKKFKNVYEARKNKNEEGKIELRKLEHEHSEIEYKREEIRNKLYGGQVTDLKQLESLLKEQEKLEEEINTIDSKTLKMMEDIEAVEEKINTMGIEERRMGSLIKKMLADRKMKMNEIEKKIAEEIAAKEEILKKINKKYIDIYMDINSKKRNPIAIIESDICTGCHMDLPIMILSKLKKQEIVVCSNCGRILYSVSEG